MKPRLSEESVLRGTGKGWKHWFAVLDKFDCRDKGHKESAKYLGGEHGLTAWWSQTVTIEYEVAKGIRQPAQRSNALFGTDCQRTVNATIDDCWAAFTTPAGLNSWFSSKTRVDLRVGGKYTGEGGDKCTYKSIAKNKRIVMTWENPKHKPGSEIEVTFTKSGEKSVVRVSHTKIANKKERDDLKAAWQSVMGDFKRYVEKI